MSLKTKILSLILLGLLVLPVLIGPRSGGSVLGVVENKSNQQESVKSTGQTQIGEIGSGAFETKAVDTTGTKGKIFTGKAIWDGATKSQVTTDKFSLGKSIKVSNGDTSLNLVVGDVRVLGTDTILVLNKDTFEKLGGDTQKEDTIEVSVIAD